LRERKLSRPPHGAPWKPEAPDCTEVRTSRTEAPLEPARPGAAGPAHSRQSGRGPALRHPDRRVAGCVRARGHGRCTTLRCRDSHDADRLDREGSPSPAPRHAPRPHGQRRPAWPTTPRDAQISRPEGAAAPPPRRGRAGAWRRGRARAGQGRPRARC